MSRLTSSFYSIFLLKNKKFKVVFKLYHMLNNITAKINNNYNFF
jgi:hypothetical protein